MQATFKMMEGLGDTNSVPVSTLDVQEGTFISNPDNNHVPFVFFRPKKYNQMDKVPCVYYLHGGGMSSLSVFYSFYQVWLRRIANQNVAVFAIDFRNSLTPSKNPIENATNSKSVLALPILNPNCSRPTIIPSLGPAPKSPPT